MMTSFAVFNRKGGCGKTTSSTALAYNFARRGYRTLLVDADAQGNATQLMLSGTEMPHGLDLALVGADVQPVPTEYRHLDMLPSGCDLAKLELQITLGVEKGDLWGLHDWLSSYTDQYDMVLIDCPPNYSTSCLAALLAVDKVLIPVGIDAYSQTAAPELIEQLDTLKAVAPSVKVDGVLITQYRHGELADRALVNLVKTGVKVYQSMIPRSDKAIESTWESSPVGVWSPRSGPAKMYEALADELLKEAEHHG